MTTTPESTLTRQDKTPYVESRALKKKLSTIEVSASNYGGKGRLVPVRFVEPDMELASAEFPGIYLAYAGMDKASDREHRGPAALTYAPAGYPTDVPVPADLDDPDSVATVAWDDDGFDRLKSPYRLPDHPIPYNLDFNIAVLTRNYQQMFEIISQLDEIDYIPARFGGLEVPEDGTVRTLDLTGGPETSVTEDESGKRLLQTVYSVRVSAEISLYELQEFTRVSTVELAEITVLPYL